MESPLLISEKVPEKGEKTWEIQCLPKTEIQSLNSHFDQPNKIRRIK